jgi:NAD(P)-dependent dehydrogenase (short-subunit alcohol dehydrogenase family)
MAYSPFDVAKDSIVWRPLQAAKFIRRKPFATPAHFLDNDRILLMRLDSMMDFTEKKVLVTGSSRGIGRSIARLFAERGASVAVHYHANRAAAEEVLASLPGEGHCLVGGDIADPAAVAAMVEEVIQRMGRIDVLVNNAAIYEDHPLAEVTYEAWQASWRAVMDINVIGAANVSYCAAQQMIRQGSGRIVNVSSRGAFRGEPDGPAYGASKAALNSMSQSLAKYLAPYNISVGVVAPGFVETDMARDALLGERGVEIRGQSPFNRVARPEEVAYAVLFLASERAEFMSGAIIDINGASYLRT